MKRIFSVAAALGVASVLSACTGTGTRDASEINALIASANGNTAIVARDTGFAGSAPRVFVSMDGVEVAALGNNEVGTFQASPGRHTLSLRFEGIDLGLVTNTLTYDNDPSRPQYFVITLKQRFASAEMKITEVSAASFQSVVE